MTERAAKEVSGIAPILQMGKQRRGMMKGCARRPSPSLTSSTISHNLPGHGEEGRPGGLRLPALPQTLCVASDKSLPLSAPPFPGC